MGKAIFRVQKLKSVVAVRGSMRHAFREQDTPNADAERTPDNSHLAAESVTDGLARFGDLLPDKVRKNAVLAVEFMVTASPETMAGKTREQQDAYLLDALEWIRKRHGAENVVMATIHRDETTPHLSAIVVPLDAKGKLNCRSFYGGEAGRMSEVQTDFWREVGQPHGLERGIERSRAKHTEVRTWYRGLDAQGIDAQPFVTATDVEPIKHGPFRKESPEEVAKRLNTKIAENTAAVYMQAGNAGLDRQQRERAEATAQAKIREAEQAKAEAAKLREAFAPLLALVKQSPEVAKQVLAKAGELARQLADKAKAKDRQAQDGPNR